MIIEREERDGVTENPEEWTYGYSHRWITHRYVPGTRGGYINELFLFVFD